ncbi:hypothetical protein H696_02634 [Fonticula alba]|uniref:COPI associated protein n=1 Tax=Fonticula alba TaxID=691883 RepID=A0A058Z7P9_FONAL|nr:hypothetical protein H696_02634 [Fonticula alba]KCV70305.1 hypothetical protein H696_02634 [Fonticula alba]|eukprot:XP_009494821.1 hypothetical protein H696_02634 [Fonticula alba]
MSALTIFFNLVNLVVGGLIAAAGVLHCISALTQHISVGFTLFVIGMYLCFFGVVIILTEMWIPTLVSQYCGFLMSFLGKGFSYIFLGFLIIGPPEATFDFVVGLIVIIIGVVYIIFQFCPVPRPRPITACAGNGQSSPRQTSSAKTTTRTTQTV